ncbi:hypothetical protein [Kitasatospora sp. NPDC092286]|uniref:hypothetical protein n=1 Tax=Kitasatospora sp. NPDC092286 TaxID=3364087 RepID=UPI0037F34157
MTTTPWRTANTPGPCAEQCTGFPHWLDDDLFALVKDQHRPQMERFEPGLYTGTCECGSLQTPPWNTSAVHEAYDQHVAIVQHELRHPGAPGLDGWGTDEIHTALAEAVAGLPADHPVRVLWTFLDTVLTAGGKECLPGPWDHPDTDEDSE